ncbi:MAG: hypothetical protein LBM92_09375 [Opitutaceae bacterium]|nr:hypothetical protein [Opitutaceae bacterium]
MNTPDFFAKWSAAAQARHPKHRSTQNEKCRGWRASATNNTTQNMAQKTKKPAKKAAAKKAPAKKAPAKKAVAKKAPAKKAVAKKAAKKS